MEIVLFGMGSHHEWNCCFPVWDVPSWDVYNIVRDGMSHPWIIFFSSQDGKLHLAWFFYFLFHLKTRKNFWTLMRCEVFGWIPAVKRQDVRTPLDFYLSKNSGNSKRMWRVLSDKEQKVRDERAQPALWVRCCSTFSKPCWKVANLLINHMCNMCQAMQWNPGPYPVSYPI